MKKGILIVFIFTILIAQAVNATIGIGNPIPAVLELKPGESGRFRFQIDASQNAYPTECSYPLDHKTNLNVEFDTPQVTLKAEEIRTLYATVNVPENYEEGNYKETFCVSCGNIMPATENAPAAVKAIYCDIPVKVDVVSVRTKENNPVPPSKKELGRIEKAKTAASFSGFPNSTPSSPYWILAIVVLLAVFGLIIAKIKKEKANEK